RASTPRSTSNGRPASPGATSTARASSSGRPTTSRRRLSTCSCAGSTSTRPRPTTSSSATYRFRPTTRCSRARTRSTCSTRAAPSHRPSARRTSSACARSRGALRSRTSRSSSASARSARLPRLVFEIGCEELPALACREAETQLPELCRRLLGTEPDRVYIGPRRLVIAVDDLPERGEDQVKRGPAERIAFGDDGKPTKAAEGFARGAGVAVDELERRDGHIWAHVAGESVVDTLPERLPQIVRGLAFTKSMKWEADGLRF